ncbi:MAG TPA: matrixin family metalloprotease [Gammaproteobacteria bacterium]|nr:matrixin family metalloprotease [Gammaproteobacteria bacterium]
MHLRSQPVFPRLIAICLVAAALSPATLHAQEGGVRTARQGDSVSYFIAPGAPGSGYRSEDRQLALWALGAWQRAAGGALHFVPADEANALVRIYWVPAGGGEYGETQLLRVGGRLGAAVYVRPDTEGLGADIAGRARNDPLFRDTVVYLTCLHELGHALGLQHTTDFDDVMYFFGFGGDIPRFFERYREQLHTRDDIAKVSGLSAGDLAQLRALEGRAISYQRGQK